MTRPAWWFAIGLVAAVVVGSGLVHSRLPDRVPTHWNLRGEIDGFGPKAVATCAVPAVLIGLLGLFAALPHLSPAQFSRPEFRSTYDGIAIISLAVLALVQVLALLGALGYQLDMSRLLVAGMLLAVALLGNRFGTIRRNFSVGVRVPWARASERVWDETHRLAASVTCGGGLVGALVALAGYPLIGIGCIVPIVAVPVVFALIRSRQLEARGEVEGEYSN